MKIGIISDLHLDFRNANEIEDLINKVNDSNVDLIINAGDLAENPSIRDIWHNSLAVPEVYIAGNHDYYGIKIGSHKWEDKLIVAATLWTNFGNNPLAELDAMRGINDFRFIQGPQMPMASPRQDDGYVDRSPLLPSHMKAIFEEHKDFILKSPRKLVVTHYPPSHGSISPDFMGDRLNPYFVNNLSVAGKKLWIHGHVHTFFDYEQEGCRIVCNPLGYPRETYRKINDYRIKTIEYDPE